MLYYLYITNFRHLTNTVAMIPRIFEVTSATCIKFVYWMEWLHISFLQNTLERVKAVLHAVTKARSQSYLASFPGPAQLSVACSTEKFFVRARGESLGTRLSRTHICTWVLETKRNAKRGSHTQNLILPRKCTRIFSCAVWLATSVRKVRLMLFSVYDTIPCCRGYKYFCLLY